ncbi:protein ECERIFERUM 16 isoform X2 [Aristolochia californica]|uniref:protein ECERIFERUM 16 isoform X2 n=1 Tax=Aristolochia californica TaxID=171875 RepID=UPI0035D9FA52
MLSLRISSTISVRGESLFSWCTDDNFIVDDDAMSTHEASFLSLDLHALAMQLEKIDISKRLFIEEDLLPMMQGLEGVEIYDASSSKDDVHPLTHEDIGTTAMDDVPDSYGLMPSTADGYDGSVDVTPSTDVENSSRNFPVHVPVLQDHQREISISVNGEAVEKSPAKFEATSAEAELDMLLNSFGEAKLLESFDMDEKFTIDLPEELHESHSLKLKDSSVPVIDQPLWSSTSDHSIDVLLSKSSNPHSESSSALPQPERPNGPSSFSVSNPLEDFESWLDTI